MPDNKKHVGLPDLRNLGKTYNYKSMKALLLSDYRQLAYTEVPDPVPADHEVLVQVKACGICGSDVHGYDGSTGRRIPPLIMGHEASGIVAAKGKDVQNWHVGDRVTFDSTVFPLNDWYTLQGRYNLSDGREVLGVSPGEYKRHGAFAEYVTIPQHILYRLPDNVTFEQAAMVEPVAVALHALSIASPSLGESCFIAGAGMIGLCLVQVAAAAGLSPIVVSDINPGRRKLAERLGAAHIPENSDPGEIMLAMSNGRGYDLSFEAVGISDTVHQAIELTRKGGRVILVGNLQKEVQFPLQQVVTREIAVYGSCAIRGEYETALKLISEGKVKVDPLISNVAPLSEGALWFEKLYAKTSGINKVILVP